MFRFTWPFSPPRGPGVETGALGGLRGQTALSNSLCMAPAGKSWQNEALKYEMKSSKTHKNLGVGPQAGARKALAGQQPISALKYLILLYIISYFLGGKATQEIGYLSLPKPNPNKFLGYDFYRSSQREAGEVQANPDVERRLKAECAHVIAQNFSVCHCTKQISKVTKALILLSDFIFRSESRSSKMASKSSRTLESREKDSVKLDEGAMQGNLVPPTFKNLEGAMQGNLVPPTSKNLDGAKRGRGSSSDIPSTPVPPSKKVDERPSAEKVGGGKGDADKKIRRRRKVNQGKDLSGDATGKAPAPQEPPKAGGKAKKRKVQETYAEVLKTNHVCYVKERGGEELLGPDLVGLQNFVLDLDLEQDEVDLTIEKGGIRDGCIWFALKAKEAVEWLRARMHLLQPLKEGHSGYDFFGPGEVPVRIFFVETSDENALKNDRFIRLIRKNNREMFENVEGGISVLESFPLKGKSGLNLKVSLDHGLVPALAERRYELYYGFGKVKFQKPMPPRDKSKKGRKEVEGGEPLAAGDQGNPETVDHDGEGDAMVTDGDEELYNLTCLDEPNTE